MSELDLWFPRNNDMTTDASHKTTPAKFITGVQESHDLIAAKYRNGIPDDELTPARSKRKKAKPGSSKSLERIGEGLTKYVLKNQLGIELSKIPLKDNFYGFTSIDVDFQGSYQRHPLKVEAKAWWVAKKSFPLSRFSVNERRYMRVGLAQGFQCWVTIALLDTEPTRGACNALYVLTWQTWLEVEAALLSRAKGNYKGKSLRKRDIDLLDGYAIVRKGRRWAIPAGHWLAGDVK